MARAPTGGVSTKHEATAKFNFFLYSMSHILDLVSLYVSKYTVTVVLLVWIEILAEVWFQLVCD